MSEQNSLLRAEQERNERLRIVALGIAAENFIHTPLGKHLIARAENKREAALAALIIANPHEPEVVQRLQNEVRLVDMVQQWLADTMIEGEATEKAMIDEEIQGGGG